jgi:hypothetical protein
MAARGMRFAYGAFFLGFAGLSLFGPAALSVIGANVHFPGIPVWQILGLAVLAQRFGGMHLQIHSTANQIVWHRVNGAGGLVTVGLAAVLIPAFGLDAIALALLGGNLVYAAMSARHSYRILAVPALQFEVGAAILPAVAMALFTAGDAAFGFGDMVMRYGTPFLGR